MRRDVESGESSVTTSRKGWSLAREVILTTAEANTLSIDPGLQIVGFYHASVFFLSNLRHYLIEFNLDNYDIVPSHHI